MSRARRPTAALALAGALLALATLPACAPSVDPFERLGRKAAERVTPHPHRAVHPKVRPAARPEVRPAARREGPRHATGS